MLSNNWISLFVCIGSVDESKFYNETVSASAYYNETVSASA